MKTDKKEYQKKFKDMKKGKISAKEWNDYCFQLTMKAIKDNKDIFTRLGNS